MKDVFSALTSLKVWMVVCICFFLSACVTTQTKTEVVIQQKTVAVMIDPIYLADCDISPPIPTQEYLALGKDEREDSLTRQLIQKYHSLKKCNEDKRSIRELLKKQSVLLEEHNVKEAQRIEALKKELEKEK